MSEPSLHFQIKFLEFEIVGSANFIIHVLMQNILALFFMLSVKKNITHISVRRPFLAVSMFRVLQLMNEAKISCD